MNVAYSTDSYSRENPSPRFRELLSLYKDMHDKGWVDKGMAAEDTFAGQSLTRQAPLIKQLVDRFRPKTMLDYGAGKGRLYQTPIALENGEVHENVQVYWGIEEMTLYDPGHGPHSTLPEGRFDGVICTDVLEHIPEPDLPWILAELFSYARVFVFGNIANYPAQKTLPNGENAHCTVQPKSWWQPLIEGIAKEHPDVRYVFTVDSIVTAPDGSRHGKAEVITG